MPQQPTTRARPWSLLALSTEHIVKSLLLYINANKTLSYEINMRQSNSFDSSHDTYFSLRNMKFLLCRAPRFIFYHLGWGAKPVPYSVNVSFACPCLPWKEKGPPDRIIGKTSVALVLRKRQGLLDAAWQERPGLLPIPPTQLQPKLGVSVCHALTQPQDPSLPGLHPGSQMSGLLSPSPFSSHHIFMIGLFVLHGLLVVLIVFI